MAALPPSTFANVSAESSWMNAAVFWRNIGMFGTPSIIISVRARSAARSATLLECAVGGVDVDHGHVGSLSMYVGRHSNRHYDGLHSPRRS